MTKPLVAFYAPIKPPDHHIASGDREIARLLVKALEGSGYRVEIASRVIAYQKRPSKELFEQRRREATTELERLKAEWSTRPESERPQLWFTYHPYCKAADWLGPAMSAEFGIPYVTAEAARTGQGTASDWQEARQQVQTAVAGAAVNFCLKQSDWEYLGSFLPKMDNVVRLTPFIDVSEVRRQAEETPMRHSFGNANPVIVTAGMMRPGWKGESYKQLAQALSLVSDLDWNLVVVGDGPMRGKIEDAFGFVSANRLKIHGAVDKQAVPSLLAQGDLFAWPGLHEAIGMVFMEAQALGLPVAAMRSLGVPLVVEDGVTGLLAAENDVRHYAEAIRTLLTQPVLRKELGTAAAAWIEARHDIGAASATLKSALDPLLDRQ